LDTLSFIPIGILFETPARFEVFTAVKIQVYIFWVVTPCSAAVGYECFGGLYCLHVQGDDANEDEGNKVLHGATTQKTWTWTRQKCSQYMKPVSCNVLFSLIHYSLHDLYATENGSDTSQLGVESPRAERSDLSMSSFRHSLHPDKLSYILLHSFICGREEDATTYLFTPSHRIFSEKLLVTQLVKQ
jgi:hypothetical protein